MKKHPFFRILSNSSETIKRSSLSSTELPDIFYYHTVLNIFINLLKTFFFIILFAVKKGLREVRISLEINPF